MSALRLAVIIFFVTTVSCSHIIQALAEEKSVPGNPEWHVYGLYRIYHKNKDGMVVEKSIRRNDGVEVAVLKNYQVYYVGSKKKLMLYSKLGFSLGNIPMEGDNAQYFYNEAIATFLEAEQLLPKAQEWLKKHNFNVRTLQGFDMYWPTEAKIHEKYNYTFFIINPTITFYCDGEQRTISMVVGLWNGSTATVTYGYKDVRSIVVHEYLHACGYNHGNCGGDEGDVFREGDKRTTYRNPRA